MLIYLQALDSPEARARFEAFYTAYRGLMFHVADRILHNSQDAEDAVHNAFLQIIKHFRKFQSAPVNELTPQIVALAKNEAISLRRKKRDEAPLEEGENLVMESETITDYHALVDSFTRLPQIYRAVMEMKLLLGYSDGEIAAKLGLTKTAVSSRINRGRKLLRNIVEQEGFLRDA